MKVLFVSAEAVPFAKVGGLADVVGSLPKALRRDENIDARVIVPGYGFIPHHRYNISHLMTFQLPLHTGTADVRIYTTVHEGVPYYFVQAWPYFGDEASVYTDWDWDVPRFIFFNQIVMGAVEAIAERLDWFPDVLHVNDWHTGLIPFLMSESPDPRWGRVASLLSIHNLAYQGDRTGGYLWSSGIPTRSHPFLNAHGLTDNIMAIATAYSDIVTTVSPRYAEEIQYPYRGEGLQELIKVRHADLYGILNGIDTELWNPATDSELAANFDATNFTERRIANKRHLQQLAGLPQNDDALIIGVVSRLASQKGFGMALPALWTFLAGYNAQLIVLGAGDPHIESEFSRLNDMLNWKARVYVGYDAATAQHIYGGSDVFLMPSHFEPCGIGQMVAMRYGALPIVRETGGLADTVDNYDDADGETGTGFVFQWEESAAVLGTLRWALRTFHERRDAWIALQRRAMQRDFSWKNSAGQYTALYQKAVQRKRDN
ncbi:MAG: glycogen synthase [Anaerolineaceae bacterium]|nr:MAG: glycogen synthase [Anaerolineaceae bacterium]